MEILTKSFFVNFRKGSFTRPISDANFALSECVFENKIILFFDALT